MSEEKQKPEGQDATEEGAAESKGIETLSLSVDRARNQILVRDESGKVVLELQQPGQVQTAAPKPEVAPKEKTPLTADQFRSALEEMSKLGLTWTADFPPVPTFIDDDSRSLFSREEYSRLQQEYPRLPREITALLFHELVGTNVSESIVGTEEEVKGKVVVLNEKLFTKQFRSDFFFKFATKVPYFETIDWEVVIKAYEKGVKKMPQTPYVLLNIIIRSPSDVTKPIWEAVEEEREPEFITVAANEHLLETLIDTLVEAHQALGQAKQAILSQATAEEGEKGNGS